MWAAQQMFVRYMGLVGDLLDSDKAGCFVDLRKTKVIVSHAEL